MNNLCYKSLKLIQNKTGEYMKTTGIVRRIDDLGRIVIPKEIRKNLNIHLGESLEIFIDDNKNLIIKKRRTLEDIKNFINSMLRKITLTINRTIIIFDYDGILNSTDKNLFNGEFKGILEKYLLNDKNNDIIVLDKEYYFIKENLIVNSDKLGMVMFLSGEDNFSELDKSYLAILKLFIENYVEE